MKMLKETIMTNLKMLVITFEGSSLKRGLKKIDY